MNIDDLTTRPAVASATFECRMGHGRAGEVRLHGDPADGWVLVVESPVCRDTARLEPARATAAKGAIDQADVVALHRLNPEWAPFYCPDCNAVYCGACWRMRHVFDEEMPGWLEETRGTCPEGHDRMMVD